MYWAEIYMRAFNPYDALEAHFPVRKRAWAPAARVFGYRVAQMSGGGALDSRGGPWYSRRSEHVSGSLEIEYPALNSIPEQVDVRIRLSWWPPRVTIIWLGAGLYRKLSSRPATGPPATGKILSMMTGCSLRKSGHRIMRIPPLKRRFLRPSSPVVRNANLAPPELGKGTQSESPSQSSEQGDDVSQEEWNDDTRDWRAWGSNNEWRPNSRRSRPSEWQPNADWGPEEPPPEPTDAVATTEEDATGNLAHEVTTIIQPTATDPVTDDQTELEHEEPIPVTVTASFEEELPPITVAAPFEEALRPAPKNSAALAST